ncbi:MAG TPA: hypothetical protein VHN14_30430 [Kofleriaceae bacterium]|nr:hypothetical protein [Kofleriaceae bacterium]
MSTVTAHTVTMTAKSVVVAVAVKPKLGKKIFSGRPGLPPVQQIISGRFKATYILWWESGPASTACQSDS